MTFNHKLVDEFLEAIFPLPEEFGILGLSVAMMMIMMNL